MVFKHERFGVASFAIQAFELRGEFLRAAEVARGKEFDHLGGHIHAARGVDAWRQAKCDVEAGELFRGRIERCGGEERSQADADGPRSSRRPSAAMVRFSPRSGTASAMVAMAAILRKLGSVFSRVRMGSWRSSKAWASLSAMAAPQSDFSG